ncbi:hypothetical protein NW759_016560 [Fusarium solani]|nr:hypothetical protein NW759_016560 [Fusarium solani]
MPESQYAKYADAYANPQGPGDARPTAQQIIDQEGLRGAWVGRVVMITGASAGIGVETARAIATTGATIYLPVRSPEKTKESLGDLIKIGQVILLELDLNSLESVRRCASEFLAKSRVLHILIENAGLMAAPEGRTEDGFEIQFGVNHLAHFLLFQLLKDALVAASTPSFNSRVIIVSSSAHRLSSVRFDNINFEGEYVPWLAYGQSKTANLWTANHLARLYGSKGVHTNSLNPSVVRTSLGRFMPDEVVKAAFEDEDTLKEQRSIPQGAAVTVYAAAAKELEGKGGLYLENLVPSKPVEADAGTNDPGYAEWAFDEENEKKLWDLSMKLVGLA